MAERKQSITSDQVLERTKSSRLPAAGTPRISNRTYSGEGLNEVPDDIDDPVDPVVTLEAPRELGIVSQTISFAPDGTQTVTVVLEFEEVSSALGYEYRISKA